MAFTVGEANSLNWLLQYLTGDKPYGAPLPSREDAENALALLLRGAHRNLAAGYRPEDAGRLLGLLTGPSARGLTREEILRLMSDAAERVLNEEGLTLSGRQEQEFEELLRERLASAQEAEPGARESSSG